MTHAICPPESKIIIFLICQQSLCYAGGHKHVAQGCAGVLIVVVWSLCLLRKSLVLSLWQKQVLKDSCFSGLYSFWVELWTYLVVLDQPSQNTPSSEASGQFLQSKDPQQAVIPVGQQSVNKNEICNLDRNVHLFHYIIHTEIKTVSVF